MTSSFSRRLAALAFLFLFLPLSASAFAPIKAFKHVYSSTSSDWSSTIPGACSAFVAKYNALYPGRAAYVVSVVDTTCNYWNNNSGYQNTGISEVFYCSEAPTVSVTSTTVCQTGPPPPCAAGEVASSGMFDLGMDGNATPPTTTCDGRCELSYNGSGVVARKMVGGAYHYFSDGSYTKTGVECSADSDIVGTPDLPPDTCDAATQDQGTVNGKFVCLNRTKTNTTTTSPEVTNPDGSKTTVTTSSNAETGEDTVTTTTTAQDGSKTETVVKKPTVGSPGDTNNEFCKTHPTDPTCTKDDIPWGDIPGAESLGVSDLAVSTNYTPIGGAGSCPADVSVNFGGTSLTWSYAPICTFAEAIRPLVIGFAWLTFGLIVAGGVRQ